MNRRFSATVVAMLVAVTATAFSAPAAFADGHAGLVVEQNGSVDTYCVAFEGNSISATDLLAKAGIPIVQWNGSVCAVGTAEGCFQPHDYASCYCQSYPPTNTYWAFFVQQDDQGWTYSPLGIQSAVAHDGDLHAWKWGAGGPASAPPPPAMSFADVCGAQTGTSTVTTPASATAVASATPQPTMATVAPVTMAAETGTPAITSHGSATATPAPTNRTDAGGSGGGGVAALAAFGGVAVLLVGAIGAAVIYRRRARGR